MSACARSCQRPPRSRTSPSRTSSQTCSVSSSRPSRSKTTASITGRGRRVRNRRGRSEGPGSAESISPTKNVCVPAGCSASTWPAANPPRLPRAVRRARRGRRRPARGRSAEPRAQSAARCPPARCEQADAEVSGAPQQLVQRRLLLDGEADERRVERERDEGAERQSQALAVQVDGDDGDARGEPPHDPPEVVAQCLRQSRSPNWSSLAFMSRSWARCATARGLNLGAPCPAT